MAICSQWHSYLQLCINISQYIFIIQSAFLFSIATFVFNYSFNNSGDTAEYHNLICKFRKEPIYKYFLPKESYWHLRKSPSLKNRQNFGNYQQRSYYLHSKSKKLSLYWKALLTCSRSSCHNSNERTLHYWNVCLRENRRKCSGQMQSSNHKTNTVNVEELHSTDNWMSTRYWQCLLLAHNWRVLSKFACFVVVFF